MASTLACRLKAAICNAVEHAASLDGLDRDDADTPRARCVSEPVSSVISVTSPASFRVSVVLR